MNQNIFLLGLFFPLLCNCSAPAEQTDTTNGGIFLTDSLKQVVTIDTVSIQEVTMELTLNGRVTFNQEQVARVYPIFGNCSGVQFAQWMSDKAAEASAE